MAWHDSWPPVELTTFVGRRSEVDSVRSLLGSARLVTVTGQWGVGKTRLAQRVATEVAQQFADGVVMVRLDTVDGVAETVSTLDRLARKNLLLLLDSCEHVAHDCARIVASALAASPSVRVLATSRWPLGLPDEQVFRLQPLVIPEAGDLAAATGSAAVELLAERATASMPDFAVGAENWPQVVELCRVLGGVPLAIELAAAWLRILPLDEVVARSHDPFGMMSRGDNKFVPPRQQSLLDSATWTYDLCTSTEQLVWQRVAVFGGTFDLAAAEAVCADHGIDRAQVSQVLPQLVEKSVVVVQDERYSVPQAPRAYGRIQLRASGEQTRLGIRHSEYFAQLVRHEEERWRRGQRQIDVLAKVRDELPNILAALEFCSTEADQQANGLQLAVSLYFYWLARGDATEGQHWISAALDRNPEPGRDRALGLWLTAALAIGQPIREAEAWAVTNGDDDVLGRVRLAQAMNLARRGSLSQALDSAIAAEEHFITADDLSHRLLSQALIIEIQTGQSSAEAAVTTAERALTGGDDDLWAQTHLLLATGIARAHNGDLAGAEKHVVRALKIAHRFGDLHNAARAIEQLAWLASDNGSDLWAAELVGIAARARGSLGQTPPLAPVSRSRDRYLAQIRNNLGESQYESACERGADHVDGIDQAILNGAGTPRRQSSQTTTAALTSRERQVAQLVAEGLTNREVADELGVAQRTAETHVDRILRKLQLSSRTQLAGWLSASQDAEAPPRTRT
ncbi:LuxR C-terminal-related transcriptional regulator [Lentzea sp. BCCO 10_0061]|uniref:LuxR C-terminal-related transcriptional regulator n=1 Tax=Lentzea sokolovensis TaxID=3095429 RepID=A0ABU4VCJ8_9PSEU|nr:LuxR C-terminal-related transcriptional regulator [Lentzea sp. BCCO 10_0061]MDX8149499.1 LuxR C-terminal-related transcriptional regulator [Lentzea sp. BCCO 10_0061]